MARRWKFVAVATAGVVLLAGCNKVTRVTTSTYQDGVRCMSQSISGDGKSVVASTMSDPSGIRTDQQTLFRNVDTGASKKVAGMFSWVGDGGAMSTDGNRVALVISARTSAGASNAQAILWSRSTGARTRLSPLTDDVDSATISGDGKRVVYGDSGDLWVRDVASTTRTAVAMPAGVATSETLYAARLSGNGRYLTFRVYNGGTYVRDLTAGSTWALVSGTASQGSSDDAASISADGRYVAYDKSIPGQFGNHAQVYVWDRTTNTSKRLTSSTGTRYAGSPSISADGTRVAYLVADSSDHSSTLLVWDRTTGKTTTAVSADYYLHNPVASADGHEVAFCTMATNLVKGSPEAPNVYVWSGN